MVGAQGPPVIVYTDAFFRPYSEQAPPDGIRCRLGWVVFDPLLGPPYGGTMPLSEDTLCRWVVRDQQVFVAESLAPLAVTVHHAESLRNRDVVWFVDNVGACSVLIKGNSSQYDAGIVTAAVHLCWARLGIRSWIEWVASDDNPSDGLSRKGLKDPWTLAQQPPWSLVELLPPPWFRLIELPPVDVGLLLQSCPVVNGAK